jgi:glycogen(starch) synthase
LSEFSKKAMLHVLQLGPYPPPEGGITRNIIAIRDELHRRGHRCSIIATSRSSNVTDEPDVYHPRSPLALVGLLRRLEFDVLHLHVGGDVTNRVLALARVATMFARGRSILTLHSGAFPLTDEARLAAPDSLRGRIFRRFSRVVAVNDELADVFRRYGMEPERLHVIAPHVLSAPDPGVAIPGEFKDFYKKHSPLLLSIGGLEKDYEPLFLITAMKDVVSECPNAGLMIVGDGSMRSDVEKAIAAGGLSENIMLAGNVPHAVTLHLINDADILLRTTLFDGDAISVREALFLGTPVIATDTAARPAGVRLIPLRDQSAMIAAIKDLISKEKLARTTAEPDNSNISAVVDLYEQLAG